MKHFTKFTKALLFIIDVAIISVSAVIANLLLTQRDYMFTMDNFHIILNSIFLAVLVYEIYLVMFRVYRHITRFESGKEYFIYIFACFFGCVTLVASRLLFSIDINSVRKQVLGGVITTVVILGVRIIARFLINSIEQEKDHYEGKVSNVLIIGAGYAARDIVRSIKTKMQEQYSIVGLIDDNKQKYHYLINGAEVLGSRNDIIDICKEKNVDEIFFAISMIDKNEKKEILEICQETGKKIRILPSTEDILRNNCISFLTKIVNM